MKVAQYAASLFAENLSVYQHTKNEKLRFWDDRRNNPVANTDQRVSENNPPIKDPVDLRGGFQTLRKRAQNFEISETGIVADEDLSLTGNLRIIKELLEKMTGKEIRLLRIHKKAGTNDSQKIANPAQSGEDAQSQRQGWGLEYTYFEETYIKEGIRFSAQGNIYTADGKTMRFDVALEMSRQRSESTQISIKAGDALIDPLVVNFDGQGTGLGEQAFDFDLNTDTIRENIRFLKPGSGFLALDKNGNGRIDDGGELFGPQSGNGFNDLAVSDDDKNGWIDENDPVFYALRIWEKDDQGRDVISTLARKNIGAIFLGKAGTNFELMDPQFSLTGRIKETGLYLLENGGAGLIQEIDMII